MSTDETDELTRLPQTLEGALSTLDLQKTLLESQRELIKQQGQEIEDLTEQRDKADSRTRTALIALAIADGCLGALLTVLVVVLQHYGAI